MARLTRPNRIKLTSAKLSEFQPIKNYNWLGKPGDCDSCRADLTDLPIFFDAATAPRYQWAMLCPDCFVEHGFGLGDGVGQMYDSRTNMKLDAVKWIKENIK